MDIAKPDRKLSINLLIIIAIVVLGMNIGALLKLVDGRQKKDILIFKVPSVERPVQTVPKVRLPSTPINDPKVTFVSDPARTVLLKESTDYHFTKDWFSGRIPVLKQVFERYKGKSNIQYLEIGAYEGLSVLWVSENILTHPSSKATVIDIFKGGQKQNYFANIQASGREEKIQTIVGASQIEMRKLPLNTFDIIYVDGSHSAGDVLEDAILAMRLLKVGGLLIFDDYGFENKHRYHRVAAAVDTFYQFYHDKFNVIQRGWMVILEKTTMNEEHHSSD